MRVLIAAEYRPEELDMLTPVENMLISQHQFPFYYEESDRLITGYSEQYVQRDRAHVAHCFERHAHTGYLDLLGVTRWFQNHTPSEALSFVQDLMRTDRTYPSTIWIGYRVMCTIRGNHPLWTFQLFSRSDLTVTPVYSGLCGPNVETSDISKTGEFVPASV